MPELLVRHLDEAVVARLKERARANGRSLQAELKRILEEAARPGAGAVTRAGYRELAERVRASLGDRPQSDSAELLAEDRAR
jgi:plasmid stability protein